jgi:hypothetical protein
MVDGFLLFTVLDVWRMVLPLGLTFILFVTEFLNRWQEGSYYKPIRDFLNPLIVRLTFTFLIISGIVGLLVPLLLGSPMPETHIAEGPWGYEEMAGFVLGGLCLWRSNRMDDCRMASRLVWTGCAVAVFLAIGGLWIGRWDAMSHRGHVPGGWFVLELSDMEWGRVVPKFFHLLFSSLASGGVLVAFLGLVGRLRVSAGQASKHRVQAIPSPFSSAVIRYGVGWILVGVVPQMFIGPWLFLVLDEVPRGGLIDGAGLASAVFFVSVMFALVALVLLNASFMVPHVKGLVLGGLISVVVPLVLMGIIRYVIFLNTLHSQGIPVAVERVTPFHLLTVMILTGLLGAILVRWCVRPHDLLCVPPAPIQRLDKRFSAN